MPRARKHLVCVRDTPYYHVTSRCVRRAFLCGVDRFSGRSYEHRRGWIEDRIRILSSVFSIQICAYAVMSNHFHLVVRLNPNESEQWSNTEVLNRWTVLFRGPHLVQRFLSGESLTEIEEDTVASIAAVYRDRLASLSWFMKSLNEPIARKANGEDGCTGHFWEARFHSQALRSEAALLTAMAYVDLNPIRARMASTPEESDYTSIKSRLSENPNNDTLRKAVSGMIKDRELNHFDIPIRSLMAFSGNGNANHEDVSNMLPIRESDYFILVDVTGRAVSGSKRARINPNMAPILERLNLTEDQWTTASTTFRKHYWNGDIRPARSA